MATISTNLEVRELAKEQLAKEREVQLSGEQHSYRLREVQDLAQQLRALLIEGQLPGPEALTPVLLKAEELLTKIALRTDLEPETRQVIEDIAALVITAKQMDRNKGIADRLQRIGEESQKAVETMRRSGVSTEAKQASQEVLDFISNWRPVFDLLSRSRDFRQLFVDSIRIVKRVISKKAESIVEEAKEGFVEGKPASTVAANVKEEIKEQSQEELQLTDEEEDTLLNEWQGMFILLAQQPTYRQGLHRMFSLFDLWRRSSREDILSGGTKTETHVRRVTMETEELVASFAGRESLDNWKSSLWKLIDLFEKHPEWNQYLTDLKNFILSTQSEEQVRSDEFKHKSKELAHRGRDLVQQLTDRSEIDNFINTSEVLFDNIVNDEYVMLLREQAGIVSSELSYVDTQGNVMVDTDMLSKLQTVLLPALAETLKYLPMPRIESRDSNREFWLDNIVLCGYDIIPENIHFHLESDSSFSFKDIETKGSYSHLVITLDKFRTELKNMSFFYKKKTFPVLMDSGVVTFRIGGEGARLKLVFTVEQHSGDKFPRLTEGYADFHIRHMDIDFDKSTLTHDILLPMMTNMWKLQIQTQIERVVEKNLTNIVQRLSEQLTQTLSEVNRPFLWSGLDTARHAMKKSEIGQVYAHRREKLE
jgi:uncharacterized membrane protein YheB (UPF0754 family)